MNYLEAEFRFTEGFVLPLRLPCENGFLAAFKKGLISGFRADFYEPPNDAGSPFARGLRFSWLVRQFCRIHALEERSLRHFEIRVRGQ